MVGEINLARPRVEARLILRLQGYRRLDAVAPIVVEAAGQMAALAETLVAPRAWRWVGRLDGVTPDGAVRLHGGPAFCSRALARRLATAESVVAVLLTVGPDLEHRAQEMLRDGHLVEGLLLDSAGWVAIDACLADLRRRLAAEAQEQGLGLGARMAPGFGDWGLEQQRGLFALFEGAGVTVRLTEAAVLVPLKSVTGLYGLIPGGTR